MRDTLRLLYEARDAMAATAFGDDAIACAPGCSYCCSHPIFVTMAEANMLARHINIVDTTETKLKRRVVWTQQCREFDKLDKSDMSKYRSPCGFLGTGGRCSVYSHRPFVCRWYNSRDAGNCERNEPVEQAHMPWDKMYMRLAQIAWAQEEHGSELTSSNVKASTKHWFLPAALLYLEVDYWNGPIPEQYSHGEYHGAGA